MLKHWDLWPLDRRHRDTPQCACAKCFGDEPLDELQVARKRKKRACLPWEMDAAA